MPRAVVRHGKSQKDADRHKRYERLLDGVQVATSVLATVADGALNVPGLKASATLVNQVVTAAQVRL